MHLHLVHEVNRNCIRRLSLMTFQLIVDGAVTLEGSAVIIRRTAEAHLFENVETALNEMLFNDHNCAEFGVDRNYMYTRVDPKLITKPFELIH